SLHPCTLLFSLFPFTALFRSLQQVVRFFSGRFLPFVGIDFWRSFVPVGNPVVRVANEDGIVAQIQQARLLRELLFVALALAQIDNGGLKEQGAISCRRGDRRTQKLRRDQFAFSGL